MNQTYLYIIIAVLVLIILGMVARRHKREILKKTDVPYVAFSEANVANGSLGIIYQDGSFQLVFAGSDSQTFGLETDTAKLITKVISRGCRTDITMTSGTVSNPWNSTMIKDATTSDKVLS